MFLKRKYRHWTLLNGYNLLKYCVFSRWFIHNLKTILNISVWTLLSNYQVWYKIHTKNLRNWNRKVWLRIFRYGGLYLPFPLSDTSVVFSCCRLLERSFVVLLCWCVVTLPTWLPHIIRMPTWHFHTCMSLSGTPECHIGSLKLLF